MTSIYLNTIVIIPFRTNDFPHGLMQNARKWIGVVFFAAAAVTQAQAEMVAVGLLSFDSAQNGLNGFSLQNLTGFPAPPGAALPPDFPVSTSLIFQGSALTLWQTGVQTVVPLGDLGPGAFTFSDLLFAVDQQFTSAVFTCTLSATSLDLVGGTSVDVLGDLTALLTPSAGVQLSPGDFAVVEVSTDSGSPPPVPEPSTVCLVIAGIAFMTIQKYKALRR